jgi:hypothetical protein
MRPYGEEPGDADRFTARDRRAWGPGGSYDMSTTERKRIRRRLKKGARQQAKKDVEADSK